MHFARVNIRNVCNLVRGRVGNSYFGNRKLHFLSSWNFVSKNCRCNSFPYQNKLLGFQIFAAIPSASLHHQQLVDDISFDDIRLKKHLKAVLEEFSFAKERYENARDQGKGVWKKTITKYQPVVLLIQEMEGIQATINDLDILSLDLEKQDENDLFMIAKEDRKVAKTKLEACKEKIVNLIIPPEEVDDKDIVVELSAGVGGQEAMLFVKDLYHMYCNFADFRRWTWEILKYDTTEIGGLRQVHLSISGFGAYRTLKLESGVHRIQRVPKTEKSGRIHTSTATVAVLPQPSDIDIVLQPRDLSLEFKRSGGAGGQHVNRTDSCVRITHIPTGIVAESQMERCQHRNRALALKSLRVKLYQRELESVTQNTEQSRKMQVGTAGRSEKVRTYNVPQNRITDHRLQQSVHDIDLFLQGQEKLNDCTESLQRWFYLQSLNELLSKYD